MEGQICLFTLNKFAPVKSVFSYNPLNHKSWFHFQSLFTPPIPNLHTYLQIMPSKFAKIDYTIRLHNITTHVHFLFPALGNFYSCMYNNIGSHVLLSNISISLLWNQTHPSLLLWLYSAIQQKSNRCKLLKLSSVVLLPSWLIVWPWIWIQNIFWFQFQIQNFKTTAEKAIA